MLVVASRLYVCSHHVYTYSERLKKSGSEGLRANEARSINSSLYFLGKCIKARAENANEKDVHGNHHHHVPFRESKLTRLLQESLSGNAKVSLIINVHPSSTHAEETISSLMFGARAMQVDTQAVVNEALPPPPGEQGHFSGVTQHGEVVEPLMRLDRQPYDDGGDLSSSESAQAQVLKAERVHAMERDEWKKEKATMVAAWRRSEAEWGLRLDESKALRKAKVKETQGALKEALGMVASLNDRVAELERSIAAMTIQRWIRRRQQKRDLRQAGVEVQDQRRRCLDQAREEGKLLIRMSLSMLHDANAALSTYFLIPQKVRTSNLHLDEAARF